MQKMVEVIQRARREVVPRGNDLADQESTYGLPGLDDNEIAGSNTLDEKLGVGPCDFLIVRPCVPLLLTYLAKVRLWGTPAEPSTPLAELVQDPRGIGNAKELEVPSHRVPFTV